MEIIPKKRFNIVFYTLFFLLIIHPFIFFDKYFNISFEKFIVFAVITVILVFLYLCYIILDDEPLTQIKDTFKGMGFTEYAMLFLLLANVISLALSEYFVSSLSGLDGRYHGFLNFAFYAVIFFIVRRSLTVKDCRALVSVITIVGAGVGLFACLQYLDFDLFNMYVGVSRPSKLSMISPIGNMNTFASYLNIVSPLAIYLFVTAKNAKGLCIYGTCVVIGAMAGISATSDSFYVGIIIAPLLLLCSGRLSGRELSRLPLAYALGAIFDYLFITLANAMLSEGVDIRPGDGVTEYLNSHTYLLLILALCFATIYLALFFTIRKKTEGPLIKESVCKILTYILLAGFVVILFAWILGFPYKNEVGSYRGFIWNLSITDFKASSFLTKLFGHGQETIYMVFKENYYADMKSVTGVVYDNVHCEVLEYLLTTGIIGLLAYITFVGGVFTKLFKALKQNRNAMAFLLPTICYFVQSFVNIAQSATTPLFFILLFMGVNSLQPDMPETLEAKEAATKKPKNKPRRK